MTTIVNILTYMPELVGVLLAAIAIIAMHMPWQKILLAVLWTLFVTIMFCWFWFAEGMKAFKKWMRKPASWEDDLPDLWI